jgi:hypothetical protein
VCQSVRQSVCLASPTHIPPPPNAHTHTHIHTLTPTPTHTQDIEEGALAKKVEQLMVKYEKDRKKRILIDWAQDKILEHRLFLQLDGAALVR